MTRPAGPPEAGRDEPPPPQDRDEPPPPQDLDPTMPPQGRDTRPPDDRDTTTPPGYDGYDGTPYRLGWLYLLVVAALVAVGIRAGDLLFLANRAWSLPWAAAFAECELAYGATAANPVPPGFTDCMAGPARERGLVMLGAVGMVLAGAALLLLLVPAVDQWRLRRHRGRFAVPGAADRFAALCDANGLTGRNRPRLLIAGPPVRQAFTIGVVGRRPIVVLPAGVAVAYRDPARFDPVVQHELAHVRARDVTWVAAVRGLVWLPVPAVAVGVLVEVASNRLMFPLGDGPPQVDPGATVALLGGSLLTVLLLASLVTLLAASLLRMREREADRHAARAGQADALAALLTDAVARTAPGGNPVAAALRRPFARHPRPLDRVRALRHPYGVRDGDLVQGLAVGAVTVVAMAAAANVTREMHYAAQGWLPAGVAAWVGAALLVGGLLPALFRRAESALRTGRPGTWWRPVTGTAIGLFVAAFGTATLVLPGADALFLTQETTTGSLLLAAATAALGAGAVALCVALASALAGAGLAAGPVRVAWLVAGHLVALAATAVLLWPLPVLAAVLPAPEAFRTWLVYVLPKTTWPAALALLALFALLAAFALRALATDATRPGTLRRALGSVETRVVAIATLVGGTAAILRTQLGPPATLDEALRAAQARWLICALTGWVVLLATATRPGPRAPARGLLAAGSATVLAGFLQYAHSAVTGRSADALALRLAVGTPLVWLLFLAALTSAVLLLRPAPSAPPLSAPARTAPDRLPEPTDRAALPGRWALPVAGLVTMLLAGIVLGPGVPGAYAPVPQPVAVPTTAAAPAATTGPTRTGSPAAGTSTGAGRPLSVAEAQQVARAVRSGLPKSWVPEEAGPDNEPRIEPAACRPLARYAYLDVLKPGERAAAEAAYAAPPSRIGGTATTVNVRVASYAEPVPASLFVAADAARAACPRFTGTVGAGSPVRQTVHAGPAPAVGEQSWRVDYALSVGSGASELTGSSTFLMVRVGHNLVTLSAFRLPPPLDERLVADALTAVVRALDRP
ncbi:M48 family metalloprotease [Micromonospora harpali]|uniref:M48 family metalloprotease n=1 Tax=Micromonospora harpali TaxID=1490225 RepID=UPI00338DF564